MILSFSSGCRASACIATVLLLFAVLFSVFLSFCSAFATFSTLWYSAHLTFLQTMSIRYSREEKGKGITRSSRWTREQHVRLPTMENSDLIKENRITLIGCVVNPDLQCPRAVVNYMPQLWGLQGRVEGQELGRKRFRLGFEIEEDLQIVLQKAPFHYKKWMLVIQKWEPIIACSFPCLIPFWITIHDLPLHY